MRNHISNNLLTYLRTIFGGITIWSFTNVWYCTLIIGGVCLFVGSLYLILNRQVIRFENQTYLNSRR